MRNSKTTFHFQIYNNFLLIFVLLLSITKIQGQERRGNNEFAYVDCGCSGVINLRIFNGLKPPYGGQEISQDNETSIGAVTVANKNDTDGDGKIDNEDNEVISSIAGRDEVDLMKLKIEKLGEFPSSCSSVSLISEGPLRYWETSKKVVNLDDYVAAIPINSLPQTVWVEATDHSSSIKDMSIKAIVTDDGTSEDVEFEEVKITAVWVNKSHAYNQRVVDPTPENMGIDNGTLIEIITVNDIAYDNSLYGYGTFDDFEGVELDRKMGGRVVFEFTLLPSGIEEKLTDFGIIYDITRRKERINWKYRYAQLSELDALIFPPKNEEPNDDDESQVSGDWLDEDTDPQTNPNTNAGKIFSYDHPNHSRIAFPLAFFDRKTNFEEFARVSFNQDCSGNITAGSRCSEKYEWIIRYASEAVNSLNALDHPYDEIYSITTEYVTTTGGLRVSKPFRPYAESGGNGQGNGLIKIIPEPDAKTNSYSLHLDEDNIWTLRKREIVGWTILDISTGFDPDSGSWTINSEGVMDIDIFQGDIPFVIGSELLYFYFYDSPIILPMFEAN